MPRFALEEQTVSTFLVIFVILTQTKNMLKSVNGRWQQETRSPAQSRIRRCEARVDEAIQGRFNGACRRGRNVVLLLLPA